MTEEFESSNADIVVAFEEVPKSDVVRYGIAKPRGVVGTRYELDDLIEKPSVEEAPSTYAVASRYVLSPAIFEALEATEPGKGGEIQLTDAIRILLKRGAKGVGLVLPPDERRFDIGNYGSYFRAFADFALADPDYGDQLRDYLRGIL